MTLRRAAVFTAIAAALAGTDAFAWELTGSFAAGLVVAVLVTVLALRYQSLRDRPRMPRGLDPGWHEVREALRGNFPHPDRDDIDTWPGAGLLLSEPRRPVTHYWPELGDARLECCGADPFAKGLLITIDPRQVTCEGMRLPGRDER